MQERQLRHALRAPRRSSRRSSTSRPTGRGTSTGARRPSRPRSVRRAHSSMKFGRDTDTGCFAGLSRRHERRIVRQRRIAAHAVVVLHAALGRQSVVVPSHRIEHRLAAHPLKPRDDVGVGVREDVADVERPADGRRRRVDRDTPRRAARRAVEAIDAGSPPSGQSTCFEAFERRFFGKPQTETSGSVGVGQGKLASQSATHQSPITTNYLIEP